MDESAVYRRRRNGHDENDGQELDRSSETNPLANDLPSTRNDALGQPERGRDEVAAGADVDLSVALEPTCGGERAEVPEDRDDAMASTQTGPGGTEDRRVAVYEPELVEDEARLNVSAREFTQMQQSMKLLIQRIQELEQRLQAGRGDTPMEVERRATISGTLIGAEDSRGERFLDRTDPEGVPSRKRYLEETELGRTDLQALDRHFGMAGRPGVSYQCELRQDTAVFAVEQRSETTAGVSSTSHDLLELEDQQTSQALKGGNPLYVAGVGWVVPLGEGSEGNSSVPPTSKGQGKGELMSPTTPWIGSPQPVSQPVSQMQNLGNNPWVANSTLELSRASDAWVRQAEESWMQSRRVVLDAEIERRARAAEQQRLGGVTAEGRLRDEGFDTARSYPVPPLQLSGLQGVTGATQPCPGGPSLPALPLTQGHAAQVSPATQGQPGPALPYAYGPAGPVSVAPQGYSAPGMSKLQDPSMSSWPDLYGSSMPAGSTTIGQSGQLQPQPVPPGRSVYRSCLWGETYQPIPPVQGSNTVQAVGIPLAANEVIKG